MEAQMSEMIKSFGRVRTGDLIRLIIQELKAGADPLTVAIELGAISQFVDIGIVMGVGEEARREFLCAQLERALKDIFSQGGHDA
jgi:hypothetical protein